MQAGTTALRSALKKGLSLTAKTKVIAEWHQNRYAGVSDVNNYGYPEATYGTDVEMFPIDQIVQPNRPQSGLPKAFLGEAYSKYPGDVPATTRWQAVSAKPAYKYWIAPNKSAGNSSLANAQPYVIFTNSCWVNKLTCTFELGHSTPADYRFDITTNGSTWTEVAISPGIGSDGKTTIYLQDNGSWSATPNYNNQTSIKGVRMRVSYLNGPGKRLGVIELSARLQKDLSDYIISYNIENSMDEPDFILPIGTVSSNTGGLTISNHDRLFDFDSPTSIYKGLTDRHVKFDIYTGIDTSAFGGTGTEYTQIGRMYADSWNGDTELDVGLFDFGTYLQDINCPDLLLQNKTAGEIIWRLLDSVGITNYTYSREDIGGIVIPYYWITSDSTVWEAIREICRSTQTAVYFDQFGTMQIQPRTKAFNKARAIDWQLDAVNPDTSNYADLQEFTPTWNLEANHVTVKYRATDFKKDQSKKSATEIIWTPDEDQVLMAAPLRKDMDSSQMFVVLDQNVAAIWPFEGFMNLEGEIISYKGKQYQWYNKSGNAVYQRIDTIEQQQDIDLNQSNPNMAWANKYTGYLYVTERGAWDSYPDNHTLNLSGGWGEWQADIGLNQIGGNSNIVAVRTAESVLRIHTQTNASTRNFYMVQRGSQASTSYTWYGTRLKFDPSARDGIAGLILRQQGAGSLAGYYVQLITTDHVERAGRAYDEIKIIRVEGNGTVRELAGRGLPVNIVRNVWYDIDVAFGSQGIVLMVNGIHAGTWSDPYGTFQGGRFGLFAQGHSPVDFEYIYANNRPEFSSGDEYGMADKYRGGIVSDQADKNHDYGYRWYKKKTKKHSTTVKQVVNYRYFDEFGPIAHEIRKYDVKFEKFPLQYSTVYLSNTSKAAMVEYNATPFSASMYIANAYRTSAIVNGDDERQIPQHIFIYGRPVVQEDSQDYVVKDDVAILRRGKVPVEFESDLLQSESAARSLGDWIVSNWAGLSDNATATVYGNPLYQVGDLVSINYPARNMLPSTHRYWVTTVSQDWDNGPTTSLTLRRART